MDTSLPVCFKEDTRNLKDAFGEVRPREIRYVGVAIDGASTAGAFAQEPAKALLAGIAAHGMIGSTVR